LTGFVRIFFAPLPVVGPALANARMGRHGAGGLLIHKDIS
jgi:hypothetical protein